MAVNIANKLGVASKGRANDVAAGSAPGTPNIGSIAVVSSTELTITFDFTAGAESFKLQRSPDNSTWADVAGATAVTENTFADTGLSAGTRYYYRYSATNMWGTSSYSNSFTESTSATNQILRNPWAAFKTQMEANATLDAYVERFIWSREPDIKFDKNIPFIQAWIADDPQEEPFDAFPKRKEDVLIITGHMKVKADTAVLLETELLKANEMISNALGSDLTLSGTGRIIQPPAFSYKNLDSEVGRIGQTSFTIPILTKRYEAGYK